MSDRVFDPLVSHRDKRVLSSGFIFRSGENSCIEKGTHFVWETKLAGSSPAKHVIMLHCCFCILGDHKAGMSGIGVRAKHISLPN